MRVAVAGNHAVAGRPRQDAGGIVHRAEGEVPAAGALQHDQLPPAAGAILNGQAAAVPGGGDQPLRELRLRMDPAGLAESEGGDGQRRQRADTVPHPLRRGRPSPPNAHRSSASASAIEPASRNHGAGVAVAAKPVVPAQ